MRRYFFAKKFEGILEAVAAQKATRLVETARKQHRPWPHRFIAFLQGRHISVEDEDQVEEGAKKGDGNAIRKLRPDMIRRMDDAPKLVNPSGWVSEGRAPSIRKGSVSSTRLQLKTISSPSDPNSDSDGDRADSQNRDIVIDFVEPPRRPRRLSDPGHPSRPNSPTSTKMHRFETVADAAPSPSGSPKRFPRTQTVEFAPPPKRPARLGQTIPENSTIREEPQGASRHFFHTSTMPQSLNTYPTSHSHHSIHSHHTIHPATSLTRDFGGFPSLFSIIKQIVKRLFPTLERKLTRTVTIPATVSLTPGLPGSEPGKKQVPYITFEAVVGRNSAFHLLTSEQLDEIGGVEYRALNALLWIVPLYHFGIQLIAFTVIAPYISAHRWDSIFNEQIRPLNRICWCLSKYLHNPAIDSIPVGVRVLAGVMQAAAVRAAGFAIVPLAALAPAVKVLSYCHEVGILFEAGNIAFLLSLISVRSTNVYEEQSLGVFNPLDHDIEDEQDFVASGPRMNVWSRYLAMHARKQLAFVFELVSAYGTVGLSLGIPDQNYSFVGAMHTLSKLIICIVMIRGRHRGLPVAIDRAIMLPSEFKKNKDDDDKNITNVDSSTDSRPFVYSETMNSRVPPDMRQRTRRGSRKWSVGSGQMGNKNDDEGEGTAHIPDHDSNKRSS
ncbi:Low-affinity potassium transport protein [Psilocybe cubensis]|uniref:Low-affinity potassium transport protein n=1 Tax=Psilocybe cubensis TaxID=181762 RepID=A0ACB8HCF4_PSICU|nr:Low-affinity potassium transport protein [Psilocybe cubensis]KAH9485514.1 Low-affinity potassium transport protein [Psilocybe cubensis]